MTNFSMADTIRRQTFCTTDTIWRQTFQRQDYWTTNFSRTDTILQQFFWRQIKPEICQFVWKFQWQWHFVDRRFNDIYYFTTNLSTPSIFDDKFFEDRYYSTTVFFTTDKTWNWPICVKFSPKKCPRHEHYSVKNTSIYFNVDEGNRSVIEGGNVRLSREEANSNRSIIEFPSITRVQLSSDYCVYI